MPRRIPQTQRTVPETETMKAASDALRRFPGANPFSQSQARNYNAQSLTGEFYPTSLYWSRFNASHELLLGTRGSGKTFILRMLAYSCLLRFARTSADPRAIEHVAARDYVGFYVASHLEWLASLPGKHVPPAEKLSYFEFAFNCRAAEAFLDEITTLIDEWASDRTSRDRAELEICLARELSQVWGLGKSTAPASIRDLKWELKLTRAQTPFFSDDELGNRERPALARSLLLPIVEVLPRVGERLGLNPDATTWVACIDEAEFLPLEYQRCINSYLRSEKRPLVAKIATLPTRHLTLETLEAGVYVEPGGNDFDYRSVDMPCGSDDFKGVTDQLCRVRLAATPSGAQNLDGFLGTRAVTESPRERFLRLAGKDGPNESGLERAIIDSLSQVRQRMAARRTADCGDLAKPIVDKFAPVYFMRELRRIHRTGNRNVGWFAGSPTIRRVADGNPRRFIQLIHTLFEEARSRPLTEKTQHKVLLEFSEHKLMGAAGLPRVGHLVRGLVAAVGRLLDSRIHGDALHDVGCGFRLDGSLLRDAATREAVDLAVDYLHFVPEIGDAGPDYNRPMRLSYTHAVSFWLPMRMGACPTLRSSSADEKDLGLQAGTSRQAKKAVRQLRLELNEVDAAEGDCRP